MLSLIYQNSYCIVYSKEVEEYTEHFLQQVFALYLNFPGKLNNTLLSLSTISEKELYEAPDSLSYQIWQH